MYSLSWADRKLSCQVLFQQGGRICICSMYQMFVSLYPYESSKVVIRSQFSSVLCPCLGTYPKVHLVAKFLYEDVSCFFCHYLFCLSPWKGCLSFFFFYICQYLLTLAALNICFAVMLCWNPSLVIKILVVVAQHGLQSFCFVDKMFPSPTQTPFLMNANNGLKCVLALSARVEWRVCAL